MDALDRAFQAKGEAEKRLHGLMQQGLVAKVICYTFGYNGRVQEPGLTVYVRAGDGVVDSVMDAVETDLEGIGVEFSFRRVP